METTKQVLALEEQRLLETMQAVNFGRIDDIEIKGGRPVVDTNWKTTRTIRVGKETGPRPELEKQDFVLKAKQVELFQHIRNLEDGARITVCVQYGLPEWIYVSEERRV